MMIITMTIVMIIMIMAMIYDDDNDLIDDDDDNNDLFKQFCQGQIHRKTNKKQFEQKNIVVLYPHLKNPI